MLVTKLTTLPDDWDDPILTRAQAQELLSQPHHLLLGQAGIGYVFLRLVPHTPADILTLYIQPNHRCKGYGRMLMESSLAAAKTAACTGLTLEVEATNTAAVRLYEVCGLQQIGKRRGYYTDPVSNLKADALVMALTLA